MKKELLILLVICPLVFLYAFSHTIKQVETPSSLTLGDSFEKLLGIETKHWQHIQTKQDFEDLAFYKGIYEKSKEAQFDRGTLFKIPKTVHLIWLGPKPFPQESVENIRNWIAYHPNWRFVFWTDRKRPPPCRGMEVKEVAEFSFRFLEKKYYASHNWGERSDILRYEILYREGGVYIDHDADCLRPFHGLHKGYDFYACLEMPHEGVDHRALTAGIGVIGAKAHHRVIGAAIQSILERWERVTEEFSSPDPFTQARLVGHRTYIALTHSLKDNLNKSGNTDIIFPPCYFYPKGNLPGFYSYHFYGTSWNNLGETPREKFLLEHLQSLKGRNVKIVQVGILSLFALIGCFILYFSTKSGLRKMSKH